MEMIRPRRRRVAKQKQGTSGKDHQRYHFSGNQKNWKKNKKARQGQKGGIIGWNTPEGGYRQ